MRLTFIPLACVAMLATACHEQKVPEQDAKEVRSPSASHSGSVAGSASTPSTNALTPAVRPSLSAPLRTVEPSPQLVIAEPETKTRREIVNEGLLPLNRILAIARRRFPGEIIEVDLDDDDDDPEYEIEILTSDGRSIEMKIDARSGTILKFEEE